MGNWVYLSYELHPALSNYGGAAGISIDWLRRMDRGDTSNNSSLQLPSHTGTHIDYPLHFFHPGKTGSDYPAAHMVFANTGIIDISQAEINDYLIKPYHLEQSMDPAIEFIIIKTGFCNHRNEEKYWKYNWGFAPETAGFLKNQFPQLRAIGFDLISLSSYQQRETGRIAHKEFLQENDLLIVEDMDLHQINNTTILHSLVVAPLRFAGADGAPVTILADIN